MNEIKWDNAEKNFLDIEGNDIEDRNCEYCGNEFEPVSDGHIFCKPRCYKFYCQEIKE